MDNIKTGEWGQFKIWSKNTLPDYALNYYDVLLAQFDTLGKSGPQVENINYANAKRVIDIKRDNLTWSDLISLDLSLMRLLPFECLRLKVAELRHRLAGLATPLPQELSPKLETVEPENINILICEAESLITQLWQVRIARNSRNRYINEKGTDLFLFKEGNMSYSRKWLLSTSVMLAMYASTALAGELRDYSLPSDRYESQMPSRGSYKRSDTGSIYIMEQNQKSESNFSPEQISFIHKLEAAVSDLAIEDLNRLLSKYNEGIDQATDHEQEARVKFFYRLKDIVKKEIKIKKENAKSGGGK